MLFKFITWPLLCCLIIVGPTQILGDETQEDQESIGKMIVDFRGEKESRRNKTSWIARALEQNVIRDLAIYPRIISVPKERIPVDKCDKDLSCRLRIYQKVGVDIVMMGRGHHQQVDWQIYDTATESKMANGTLRVGPGSNRRALKMETYKAVALFLEKGGILDQLALSKAEKVREEAGLKDEPGSLWYWFEELIIAQPQLTRIILLTFIILVICMMALFAVRWRVYLKTKAYDNSEEQRRDIISDRRDREKEGDYAKLPPPPVEVDLLPIIKFPSLWILNSILVVLLVVLFWQLPHFPIWATFISQVENSPLINIFNSKLSWALPVPAGLLWGFLIIQVARFLFPTLSGFEQLPPSGVFTTLRSWALVSTVRGTVVTLFLLPGIIILWLFVRSYNIPFQGGFNPIIPFLGLLYWLVLGLFLDALSFYFDREAVSDVVSEDNPWNRVVHLWLEKWSINQTNPPDLSLMKQVVFLPGRLSDLIVYGGGFTQPRIVIHEQVLKLAFKDFTNSNRHLAIDPEDILEKLSSENSVMDTSGPNPLFHGKDFFAAILLLGLAQVHRKNHWINCYTFLIRKSKKLIPSLLFSIVDFIDQSISAIYQRYPATLLDSYVCSYGNVDSLAQFLCWQLDRTTYHLTTGADKEELRAVTYKILQRFDGDGPRMDKASDAVLRRRIHWIGLFIRSSADGASRNRKLSWRALLLLGIVTFAFTASLLEESWNYHPKWQNRIENKEKEIRKKIEKWQKKEKKYEAL